MTTMIDESHFIIADPIGGVETGATKVQFLAEAHWDTRRPLTWHGVIDETLREWMRDPDQFEDENVIPPTLKSIYHAGKVAATLAALGWNAPDRVMPNGDGGIVFERKQGDESVTIEILDDGSAEFARFRDCRMIERAGLSMTE